MAPSTAPAHAARLTAAFDRPIARVRTTFAYRVGIVLVALTMIALPMIYVGLVCAVGYAVFWHATGNTFLLVRGKAEIFAYGVPIVVGVILLLFMIKPLFARRARSLEPIALDPGDEPTLFEFVHRLTDAVGAPRPRRIHVDQQVNASAGFRRGFVSMLGNDLVLTIGMPLVAGLNLRQFTGVLAHEFGHFAQGSGMRFTYVIRSVSAWFARVVYEQDAWDVRLDRWARDNDFRIMIILQIARGTVWLTRKILLGLMIVGNAVSSFMLRRMEFDADRYEARVAGSTTFEATARRLVELNVANGHAIQAVQGAWQSGRLADDLSALTRHNAERLTDETRTAIRKHMDESRTGWMDTHPSDSARIASARREAAAGIFDLEEPATGLFADFDALSRRVTVAFYEMNLDRKIEDTQLVPFDRVAGEQRERDASFGAMERYFQDTGPVVPPLWPGESIAIESGDSPAILLERLRTSREAMEADRAAAGVRADRYGVQMNARVQAALGESLARAGLSFDVSQFGMDSATEEGARDARRQSVSSMAEIERESEMYLATVRTRMFAALELLKSDAIASSLDDAVRERRQVERALLGWRTCQSVYFEYCELVELEHRLHMMLSLDPELHKQRGVQDEIRRLSDEIREALDAVQSRCSALYPFGDEGRSVGDQCVERAPADASPPIVFRCCSETTDRLGTLRVASIGALVQVAVAVELAVGLPDLPAATAGD